MNSMRYGFFLLLFAVGSSFAQSSAANNQNNSSSHGQVLFSRGDSSTTAVRKAGVHAAIPATGDLAKNSCRARKSYACNRCRTQLH